MTPATSRERPSPDIRSWRFDRIEQAGLDAVVAFLPHHVFMLSGYRPRLGGGIALATADSEILLAVPMDEVDLARVAGVRDPVGYEGRTLEQDTSLGDAMAAALRSLARNLPNGARIGYEDGPVMTPNAYVSTLQLGSSLERLLAAGLRGMQLTGAGRLLREMAGRKTEAEIALLRLACALGEQAFAAARAAIAPGRYEFEITGAAMAALAGSTASPDGGMGESGGLRTGDRGGAAWVMSGPNSALAYRAFAATGSRRLEKGDLVLVHMNPQIHGFWSDLTRTFVIGEPDVHSRAMLTAILEAAAEVRTALRPGARARDVDAIARSYLAVAGYDGTLKHQLGHGIGFNGISGTDAPSLHPLSDDILSTAMCFNVEPALYLDGFGGCRQCDALVLGDGGPEELSPFLSTLGELIITN